MKEKEEKQLYLIWKEYIDVPIYRVVVERDYSQILKNGLDPHKNPFKKILPLINKLLRIVENLESKEFVMLFSWGTKKASGSYMVKTAIDDISASGIDFTPSEKEVEYYMMVKGGGTVWSIRRVIKRLIEEHLPLSKGELKIVRYLKKWAEKRICENKAIYVFGSIQALENAFLYLLREEKRKVKFKRKPREYLESPFGSFEHFKKIIKKYGLRKYLYWLKTQKFYLRVKNKIPASEIKRLK